MRQLSDSSTCDSCHPSRTAQLAQGPSQLSGRPIVDALIMPLIPPNGLESGLDSCPPEDGSFARSRVRSIYRNRAPCGGVRAGQCASVGLLSGAPRPGMVLLAPPPRAERRPVFCGCRQAADIKQLIEQNLAEKTKNRKNVRRKNKNLLRDIATAEECLTKDIDDIDDTNIYEDDDEDDDETKYDECACADKVMLEDPNDPRGCIYFQASVQVLRHSTVIYPGFQCTVHVGNVRQTAIIEGIMSLHNVLRADETASVLFRFVRCPEYLVRGRRLLFTAGLGTRGIGRITQVFPYIP